jgi:transposase
MPHGVSDKIRFKPYEQHQQWLLPPSADELVPQGHMVRKVSEAIDELDLEGILRRYTKGGGASRYHPVMLLKVLVYGYMTGIYSSRHLARGLRENVMYMWLAGNQKPDFRTINAFRGDKLKPVIQEVFAATAKLLAAKGYIKLENHFVDGTKIESAAGKYTFVWKRAVDTNDRKLDERLKAFVATIDRAVDDENEEYGDRDLEELGERSTFTAEDVKALAATINRRLAALEDSEADAPVKKN